MFSQLSGQQETDGGLDLPAGDGVPFVVVGKSGGFARDAFENIVNERVHDGHGFAGDSSVGMDLLHHLVDIDGEALLSLLPAFLLVGGADGLLGLSGFLDGFSRGCGRHCNVLERTKSLVFRKVCIRTGRPSAYFLGLLHIVANGSRSL